MGKEEYSAALDQEQPGAGVNVAALKDHCPALTHLGTAHPCSPHQSHPSTHRASGMSQALLMEIPVTEQGSTCSLTAQGESNQEETKKAQKKLRIRQFETPAPPSFQKHF